MLKALRDIRSLRVHILHPKDRECDELVAQVRRIGCRVEAVWPPQDDIPPETNIAFLLFRQDILTDSLLKALADRLPELTLIGIVEFESPAVIEAVVRAGAKAVITKPIRPFGLLTSMIIANTLSERIKSSSDRLAKLQARINGLKRIEQAKSILMSRKGLSEQDAYDTLRERAMAKRTTMESISSAIIEANEFFGT
ncbi:ANTAR domain-containing response regulator [Chelatococcus reniformis]|uniref:Transcription antitermination regulator n=1 Tax=Chelatococcus reniformis TaxID=1494448 RepID=A0A916UTN2_9HYPH|nr:ANTAR domain-containing protein [Chelatococcus reniformis]GGC87079.1 transcription antitermination regulator [Chelatococcus reniformis]